MKILNTEQLVPSHVIKTTIYIAEDGKEFFRPEDCACHENHIRTQRIKEKIKHIDIDIFGYFLGTFQYIDSKETLDVLLESKWQKEIKIGDWIIIDYNYNPNGANNVYVITLDKIKQGICELEKEIVKLGIV